MSVHFSVRDVLFTPSTTGVRIIATTDIPCHLYCRLSSEKPWIHKTPSLRRGVQFAEDVRFCFTVYEDNEQYEAGDTNIHTWWKTDWPPSTTKYFYFWGTIGIEVSVSTTPYFKYHNDGLEPVPAPDFMYQLNSIDPQHYSFASGASTMTADLSRDVPPFATGAILQFRNPDPATEHYFGCWKPGVTPTVISPFDTDGTLWVIVGLDQNRCFEYFYPPPGAVYAYLMGYTGPDVVFPDTPINIAPALANTYETRNIGSIWPDAKIILTDLGSNNTWDTYFSIRPLGSTKEVYQGAYRKYPICGVPDNGLIELKTYQAGHPSTRWQAYAYLKKDCTISLNGIDFQGFTGGAWKTLYCGGLHPDARWAFLEYFHPARAFPVSARKEGSWFDYQGTNSNHSFMIAHLNHYLNCQVWTSGTNPTDQLLQIAETH